MSCVLFRFGMKRGWLDSFSNHATTSYLSSTLLTWKWPSSWQGYDCNNFFCFQLWLPFDPLHCLVNLQEAGVDWIIHLDTDELMHPAGTSEYLYGNFWQIYLKMLTWSYFLTMRAMLREMM
ncbi:hypothetical protein KY285_013042 [Solanum tuberosum]|nr:hypothetical protein KY285_013042 [Solanum tuberosum]